MNRLLISVFALLMLSGCACMPGPNGPELHVMTPHRHASHKAAAPVVPPAPAPITEIAPAPAPAPVAPPPVAEPPKKRFPAIFRN